MYVVQMYGVHVSQCKHSSHMYGVHVRRTCTPYMYHRINTPSVCRKSDSLRSYFRVPLMNRAAAFKTSCNLSVTDFGAGLKVGRYIWHTA